MSSEALKCHVCEGKFYGGTTYEDGLFFCCDFLCNKAGQAYGDFLDRMRIAKQRAKNLCVSLTDGYSCDKTPYPLCDYHRRDTSNHQCPICG